MQLVDTHCHIHDSEFSAKFTESPEDMIKQARDAGVDTLVCVGTDVKSSKEALAFAGKYPECYASVAVHPHEAEKLSNKEIDTQISELRDLIERSPEKLVAIGECGLDHFYHEDQAVKKRQIYMMEKHLELAQEFDLPLIFHIREAFSEFFDVIDNYDGVRGVVHSFSAGKEEVAEIVKRDLYMGLNGIMTFTKDERQTEAAKHIPIENLVLETDAPFLTPVPFRGKINTPKHVIYITQFLCELRGESQAFLAEQTTKNAKQLFNLT